MNTCAIKKMHRNDNIMINLYPANIILANVILRSPFVTALISPRDILNIHVSTYHTKARSIAIRTL